MDSGFSKMEAGALRLASLFKAPVFPCRANDKKPAIPGGFKNATTDPEAIRAYWRDKPECNVGMATGSVVVIDLDDHSGIFDADGNPCKSGAESLAEWEELNGELPKTLSVKTGKPLGQHLWYSNPEGLDINCTSNSTLAIDIRGYGGYVIAPPSVHPNGTEYSFLEDPEAVPLAPIDGQVMKFIEYVKGSESRKGRSASSGAVLEGGRNNAVFREAARLQGAGLSDEAVMDGAKRFNDSSCIPPLPDREVAASVQSALRYRKGVSPVLSDFFESVGFKSVKITDKELGRLFANAYRGVLAWVPDCKRWYAYDGAKWDRIGGKERAERLCKEFVDAATLYIAALPCEDRQEGSLKALARYESKNARANLLSDAQSELVQYSEAFDAKPYLLNTRNCTIDFGGSGEPVIREHRPEDLLTQVAPVEYDPNAKCPLFVATLSEALEGDADLIAYVQKLFGKVIASDTTDDRFHLLGEQPRTGKTTVTAPLVEMLGNGENGYAKNAQPETFATKQFQNASGTSGDRARLRLAKLVIASEPPAGMELNASVIKEMTGNDLITARQLYSEEVQFRMRGQLLLLANNFPTINDASVLASNRVCVIPFRRVFTETERKRGLRESLRQPGELSGLLNWCIEGVRRYRAEGFEMPAACADATAEYEARMDVVSVFWGECMEPRPGAVVPASDVFECYQGWCRESCRRPLGRNDFYNRLRQRPYWRDVATIQGKSIRRAVADYSQR